jgi:hypothetical protein
MLEDQHRLNVLLSLRCVGKHVCGEDSCTDPAGGSHTDTTLVHHAGGRKMIGSRERLCDWNSSYPNRLSSLSSARECRQLPLHASAGSCTAAAAQS